MDNWGGQWPLATVFSNNIFYVEDEIKYDYGKARKTVFENNLYFGKHLNAPDDSQALKVDPLFVDPGKKGIGVDALFGYRVKKNSPCITAGKVKGDNGGRDFSGAELPADNKPTVGAFEYNAPSESSHDIRIRPWRQAKFGLFLHWGPCAIYGGTYKGKELWSAEWIQENARIPWVEYSQTASGWNPSEFDAPQWVSYAKAAGMKYLVITAKHHDGFAIYHSKASKYNIMDWTKYTGPDPLMALKEACEKEGIMFGIYYSPLEYRGSPRGFDKDDEEAVKNGFSYKTLGPKPYATDDEIAALAKAQIAELIEKYEPKILWFDGCWHKMGRWLPTDASYVEEMIRQMDPRIVINDRVGAANPDFRTFEGAHKMPATAPDGDWELCWNIGCFWGYNPRHYSMPKILKTPEHYIEMLVEIASKGGNYLLNVGPDPSGKFHPVAVKYLKAIGQWVRSNGECIYGTTKSPFAEKPDWGYVTAKPNKLFLIVKDWPSPGKRISFPALDNKIIKAYLLNDIDCILKVEQKHDIWSVVTNESIETDPFTVIVLDVEAMPQVKR